MDGIDLGEEGHRYIVDKMSGGLSLSRKVLDKLSLSTGSVWGFAPAGHPDVWEFGSGSGSSSSDPLAAMVELIRQAFVDHSRGALWVEEPLPKRSDPFFDNPATAARRDPKWFLGEEVYSLAFPAEHDDRIRSALQSIYPFPGWGGAGFLSGSTEADSYRDSVELRHASLEDVAALTTLIIAGAYDGEGFLVWRSSAQPA